MQKQKQFLTEEHYLIKFEAENNNCAVREAWKPRYVRFRREKKSKLWRVWYRLVDIFNLRS